MIKKSMKIVLIMFVVFGIGISILNIVQSPLEGYDTMMRIDTYAPPWPCSYPGSTCESVFPPKR